MSIHLRIKEIRKKKNLTQAELSEALGMDSSQYSKVEQGKLFPTIPQLTELCSRFDIDATWLLTGTRKAERVDYNVVREPDTQYGLSSLEITKLIPLVSIEAVAGFGSGAWNISKQDIQAHYFVPDFEKIDFMIRVKGSSMYPKYNSGDVVACRKISQESYIQWNKTHVIGTLEQGIMVKRIRQSKEPGSYLIVSDNPSYEPFDLPKSDVTGLAIVVGTIRLE